jgi:hypothetical protein
MTRREWLQATLRDLDAMPVSDRTLGVQTVIGDVRRLATKQEPPTDAELRLLQARMRIVLDIDARNRGEACSTN